MSKSSKRKKYAKQIGEGNPCPKCKRTMGRFEHGPKWKPKRDQPFYFQYWDKCRPCKHIQLYERAKIWIVREKDPLIEEYKAIIGR